MVPDALAMTGGARHADHQVRVAARKQRVLALAVHALAGVRTERGDVRLEPRRRRSASAIERTCPTQRAAGPWCKRQLRGHGSVGVALVGTAAERGGVDHARTAKVQVKVTARAHARATEDAHGGSRALDPCQAHRALHAEQEALGAVDRIDGPVRLAGARLVAVDGAQRIGARAPAEDAAHGVHHQPLHVGPPGRGQRIGMLLADERHASVRAALPEAGEHQGLDHVVRRGHGGAVTLLDRRDRGERLAEEAHHRERRHHGGDRRGQVVGSGAGGRETRVRGGVHGRSRIVGRAPRNPGWVRGGNTPIPTRGTPRCQNGRSATPPRRKDSEKPPETAR